MDHSGAVAAGLSKSRKTGPSDPAKNHALKSNENEGLPDPPQKKNPKRLYKGLMKTL